MKEKPTTELSDGTPITPDHRAINPDTGQQKGYVVLTKAERDKGFVRSVRTSYIHVGKQLPTSMRDLTREEQRRYADFEYIKFEAYPEGASSLGRFWTLDELAAAQQGGCGTVTRMGQAIAETYAREPKFYSKTFCSMCKKHLPVSEFVWDGTDERVGS